MYEVDAFEKGFEPGEIFRFVKRMNEGREGKSKIVRVWRVFILPDGTRAGVVRLDKIVRARAGGTGIHYSWDLPFKGETLIEEIRGKSIIGVNPYTISFTRDGKLVYKARLKDGRCVILKGDTVIEEIQGRRFKELSRLLALSDGTVAGVVELEDDRWVPFKGDALLEEIEDRKVMHSYLIYSLPDGTFAGQVETLYEEREIHEYFFWHGHEVYIPQPPDPDRARDLD
ncbi:MAG: hypothetical protein QXU11_07130 [Thermoproteota archaeon]